MAQSEDHMAVPSDSLTKVLACSIADQSDCQGYVIEAASEGLVKAVIVCTKQVNSLLKSVKKLRQAEGNKDEKYDVLSKNTMLASFACTRDLFYSKALLSMFNAFIEANVKDSINFALIIDKYEDLVLSFLSELNMRRTHEGRSFIVIKKN
jgi:hypothetical protein